MEGRHYSSNLAPRTRILHDIRLPNRYLCQLGKHSTYTLRVDDIWPNRGWICQWHNTDFIPILTLDIDYIHLWLPERLHPPLRQGFSSQLLLLLLTLRVGGYFGDLAYRRWGVPGKKYLMISLGITQGLLSLGLGIYIDHHEHPSRKQIFPVSSQDTDLEQ